MVAKEYCCYTRPYSNIEGYQRAYTLCYYASLEKEGVVLAVQRQQGGECTTEQVICPTGDFGRLMPLMYGSRGRPAKRKADAICSICWF